MNVSFCLRLCGSLAALATWFATAAAAEPAGPLSPADSLAAMQLADDVEVTLAAAEPLVIDPVAIRFDERGRMWVVEMRDYPHGPAEGAAPQSRIRILEDRDRDGSYEAATTFADSLLFATGIQPWKQGAFVTVSGAIIYLQDTNGDGQADSRATWFTGFAEENSQLRANHPRLGVDGWIYVANGLRGGAVSGLREGDEKLDLRGADFRFNPHTRDYEAVSGPGQFGLTFDGHGNRFVCSNRHPLDHVVLERRYQAQNPLAPAFAPLEVVAAEGADSKIFPISEAWTTSNLHAGQFTAACGVLVQRGTAMPGRYRGAGFTCDPTGNLVHVETIAPAGPTFRGEPMFAGREFLASRDTWFRPVNLENGPGGDLFVVDMYRAVIEHPQFMPEELKQRPDLLLGNDLGRIYRVQTASAAASTWEPIDAAQSTAELVALLGRENAWQRDTALRLLYQRGLEADAIEQLKQLVQSDAPASARIAALHLLKYHGQLDLAVLGELLAIAPADASEAAVVRQAIIAGEDRYPADANLRARVLGHLAAGHAVVQFQAALTAGSFSEFDATLLTPLFREHSTDVWMQRAVLIAAGHQGGALLEHLLRNTEWELIESPPTPEQLVTLDELARMTASAKQSEDVFRVAAALGRLPRDREEFTPLRLIVATSLAAEMARRGESLGLLKRHANAVVREPVAHLFADAVRIATDDKASSALRIAAIALAAYEHDAGAALVKLASDEGNPDVRAAAIRAIAPRADLDPWQTLLTEFPHLPPTVRVSILDSVLRTVPRTRLLLDAVEAGVINLGEIDPLRMKRLQTHADADIRSRTQHLLDELYPAERKEAIAAHRQALGLAGDSQRGRQVFQKNCAACHRIGDVGQQIGPDISDSRVKTPAQLLTDILEPNLAIDANYIGYTVQTSDGKVYSGLVEAATDSQVTLRIPENNSILSLARTDIEQMISTGASLMPEGFEKNVSIQEMADLIAFIKNWRYLDGAVPLPASE